MHPYRFRAGLFLLLLGSLLAADKPNLDEELRQELLQMVKVDQEARMKFVAWLKKQGNPDSEPLKKGETPEVKKLEEIDRKNTTRLKEIVDKHGWPSKTLVGKDGAKAAWLLVQHADKDRAFQKKALALMKPMLAKGEVGKQDFAYLTDRVLVGEEKKQIYGTQCKVVKGKVTFQPIEDEANVDKRRAEVGLPPLVEYQKMVEQMYLPKKD